MHDQQRCAGMMSSQPANHTGHSNWEQLTGLNTSTAGTIFIGTDPSAHSVGIAAELRRLHDDGRRRPDGLNLSTTGQWRVPRGARGVSGGTACCIPASKDVDLTVTGATAHGRLVFRLLAGELGPHTAEHAHCAAQVQQLRPQRLALHRLVPLRLLHPQHPVDGAHTP